jgi:hypothetical protein
VRRVLFFTAVALASLLLGGVARAATFNVTTTANDGSAGSGTSISFEVNGDLITHPTGAPAADR